MKLAFLISAYKDPIHLKRFIDRLPDNSVFYIHIDKKVDANLFTSIMNDSRVHFLDNRVKIAWGSFSQVEYQMRMIKAALNHGEKFDYLVMLSGQDYPVFSKQEIIDFFERNQGKNYISGIDMSRQNDRYSKIYKEYRILQQHDFAPGTITSRLRVSLRKAISLLHIRKKLIIKTKNKSYNLYKGSDYWAITSEAASYVLSEWETNKELCQYFKTSFAPSETFTQTVLFNSEFSHSCILYEGEYPGLSTLTPLTYIYYHPTIKVLTKDDYDVVVKSGKMFCRKTETGISDELMDLLDKRC